MEYNSNLTTFDYITKNQLLDGQQLSILIFIYSILMVYEGILQQKEVAKAEYNNEKIEGINPQETINTALNILFFAQFLTTLIGFRQYNYLYNKSINGEYENSLDPNRYTNIGNLLWLIGIYFLIKGAEEI